MGGRHISSLVSLLKSCSHALVSSAIVHSSVYAVPESVDVAIIGAGVAGLTAARDLRAGGKVIAVLEAKNRIGGKVVNKQLQNGDITELGGEYLGPAQDDILELLSELNLTTFKTYDQGQGTFWRNSTRTLYTTNNTTGTLPPVDPPAYTALVEIISELDTMAAGLDINAPWTHPNATEWDKLTWEEWINAKTNYSDTRFLTSIVANTLWQTETKDLSLFFVISAIAAAGNETTKGNLERMIGTRGGSQESRVEGGTARIPERLAEIVGYEHIFLQAAVSKISKVLGAEGYQVETKKGTVLAKKVVLALGPTLVNKISFEPALPYGRQQLNSRMQMGHSTKAVAIYDTPWWRTKEGGLKAQALSDIGATRSTFDNSNANGSFGAILCFVMGNVAKELDPVSASEIRANVTSDLVRYFGDKAKDIQEFVLQRWDLEEFIEGGAFAVAPPNVWSAYGQALREPVDGLYFAGSETSEYWIGYITGAIRSGHRVSKEILGTYK